MSVPQRHPIALAGFLALAAFTAGVVSVSAVTYEDAVTPHLEACVIVREARLHGIDPRTLRHAYLSCALVARFMP